MQATFYLAGASWCPHTQEAMTALQSSTSTLPGPITMLQCAEQDATNPICQAVKSYPVLAACDTTGCFNILDGYFPDYSTQASRAMASFLAPKPSS